MISIPVWLLPTLLTVAIVATVAWRIRTDSSPYGGDVFRFLVGLVAILFVWLVYLVIRLLA